MRLDNNVEIALFEPTHLDQVVALTERTSELESATVLDGAGSSALIVSNVLNYDENWTYIAYRSISHRVIGTSLARPHHSPGGAELVIPALVEPDFRGQGLGGELLERNLRALREMQLERVTCLVRYNNASGIRFLEHHGFGISEDRITDSVCLMAWRNLA